MSRSLFRVEKELISPCRPVCLYLLSQTTCDAKAVITGFINSIDGFFVFAGNIDTPQQRYFNVSDHRWFENIAINV